MNPISAFFIRNIIAIFFFYGLAFFSMGLALALASRRTSEFKFVRAIRPLAVFGIFHGTHEWIEMFQKMAMISSGYTPPLWHEVGRLAILMTSFLMLSHFGLLLLLPQDNSHRRTYLPLAGLLALWLGGLVVVAAFFKLDFAQVVPVGDTLARYTLGIPGALLGAWALMKQQHTFRLHSMPQFGRNLVWCAAALLLYGVLGQFFVGKTVLWPSTIINAGLFLNWFGIPVQLFRGLMATVLAMNMLRALNAFELESRQRLEQANREKLSVQAEALQAERRISRQMEKLNEELRLLARELTLLLDVSNMLAGPLSLQDRLHNALEKIVQSLQFLDAGLILLIERETGSSHVRAISGFSEGDLQADSGSVYAQARELGEHSVKKGLAMCKHLDGQIIEFELDEALTKRECQRYMSPAIMVALPLMARQQVIGGVVLAQAMADVDRGISFDEFKWMTGIGQQLGLSIENARLYQEAQRREKLLAQLLHQAVGAQEAERQRIARELHDATGQSLTAIGLGLKGVESILGADPTVATAQVRELKSFSTNALGELRRIIADLRPSQLDDLGLLPALRWYAQEFENRYAVPVSLKISGATARLSSEYETVLFRIIQEALTNIAKHAGASLATVELSFYQGQIRLRIKDDGRGFNLDDVLLREGEQKGWGLPGIMERAVLLGGEYHIDSAPGAGTTIEVNVPLITEAENVQNSRVAG